MKAVTTEEAWAVLRQHGYHHQFEGDWLQTHPGQISVGRAVTAQFLPHRPDYHEVVQQAGLAEGQSSIGGQNSWIIESLGPGDMMVVDIFGKVKDGTVVGDNLGTAVATRTGVGAIIDGGIRDYQGLLRLDGVNFFVRGVDPSAIAGVTLAGINLPIRKHLYFLRGAMSSPAARFPVAPLDDGTKADLDDLLRRLNLV